MTTQFRSHNGAWHVASTERFLPGTTVTVTRRNGRASDVIIRQQIAHDPNRELPYLYAFEDVRRASGAQAQFMTTLLDAPAVERLFALFERAAAHSHSVAVRFALNSTARGLRFEMATSNSRYAGQLLALSEQRNGRGSRSMYGSLNRIGQFTGNVGATQIELEIFNEVAAVLRSFAADPAGYAATHGRATGNCCFCGRGLTDERSVTVGYGPICADHFGLPWGDATAPAFDVTQGSRRQLERMGDNMGRENAFDHLPPAELPDDMDTSMPTPDEAANDSVPTLEDIQNEPNAFRRMAMAANRASAGLQNVMRDAQGRVIVADIRNDRTVVGAVDVQRDPNDPNRLTATVTAPVRAGQVVTRTVRRLRASAPTEPAPASVRPSFRERLAERANRREGVQTPTDETVTTVVRAQRRPANSPLEEDDFVWPPRNT